MEFQGLQARVQLVRCDCVHRSFTVLCQNHLHLKVICQQSLYGNFIPLSFQRWSDFKPKTKGYMLWVKANKSCKINELEDLTHTLNCSRNHRVTVWSRTDKVLRHFHWYKKHPSYMRGYKTAMSIWLHTRAPVSKVKTKSEHWEQFAHLLTLQSECSLFRAHAVR